MAMSVIVEVNPVTSSSAGGQHRWTTDPRSTASAFVIMVNNDATAILINEYKPAYCIG